VLLPVGMAMEVALCSHFLQVVLVTWVLLTAVEVGTATAVALPEEEDEPVAVEEALEEELDEAAPEM